MIISMGASGKSLYMSVNHYIEMTDDDFKMAVAYDQGFYCNHPFTDTALIDMCEDEPDEIEDELWVDEDAGDNDLFDLDDLAELMQADPQD